MEEWNNSPPKDPTKQQDEMMKLGEYWHGFLPIQDAEKLMEQDGDFLLTETILFDHMEIVLSVQYLGQPYHFRVEVNWEGKFTLDDVKHFSTIQKMIKWHRKHPIKLSGKEEIQIQLSRPIGKQQWEIWDEEMELEKAEFEIGAFGKIHKAILNTRNGGETVVVKLCSEEQWEHIDAFMREVRIMRKATHQNICEIIGVQTLESPLKLVLTLAEKGNLHYFLRPIWTEEKDEDEASRVSISQKLRFALDASTAMEFLEKNEILYLGLEAKNCLVKSDEDTKKTGEYAVVISDFGKSRMGKKYKFKKGEKYIKSPEDLRWAPPELMEGSEKEATVKSDVWSLGMLIWEILTDGSRPYPDAVTAREILMMREERRPLIPDACPPLFGELMMACWNSDPLLRPTFKECRDTIKCCYCATK